jgi:hypothetical protein
MNAIVIGHFIVFHCDANFISGSLKEKKNGVHT